MPRSLIAAVAAVLLAVLLAGTTACGSRRQRSRCERVCDREHECSRELDLADDEGECVAECSKLERDPQLQRLVDQHVRCVDEAASCSAVLDCP